MQIQVNGRQVEANPGEMLLSALRRNGVQVPTLCHMEGRLPSGACRLCVVDVEGMSGLVPSCAFPAREGMKVQTHSPRAVRARKTIIELLLAAHPDDCLYCPRAGNCDLQRMAEELGVRQRRYTGEKNDWHVDSSSPSIVRDPAKCILCGRCVRVCEEIQGVSAIDFVGRGAQTRVAPAFDQGLNVSSCVDCGQCILSCPTGALTEQSHFKDIFDAIENPEKVVVVQHAPAVSVTLGELFGVKPGTDLAGLMTAALRRLGFDHVFDTSFAADLTVMEEASELVGRIREGGALPLFTSCCPAWVDFVGQEFPDLLGQVSTCKSPQQMLGAVAKSWFAGNQGVDPGNIYSVAVMPCTAKKFEATLPAMVSEGQPDVDAVITTRELARIIRMRGIDLRTLEPETADTPFGTRSSAGKLFGATGGVMEAAIRTAHHMVTGRELDNLKVREVRGLDGVKEGRVMLGDLEVGVAVVSGLANARRLVQEIRAGRSDLHFIEVMACPGGCIQGGGQPIGADMEAVKARMQALYAIDRDAELRTAHGNPDVRRLYDEFLGRPLCGRSHDLLHTTHGRRQIEW
jgi:NADH-quinone oxidoreductase subunit G/NADP-reducing hydrogenase subunit HndD